MKREAEMNELAWRRPGDNQTIGNHHALTPSRPHPVRTWPLLTILAVLFLGPLIAPLFQATSLPFVAGSGALARDLLAHYICPTPAKSYMLLGFPMAVCARCWGATIGLGGAWRVWRSRAHVGGRRGAAAQELEGYGGLWWPARMVLGALPFLVWALEISLWPAAPLWVLLLNGALAGFGAGLFFCSIWPGLRRV